MGLLQVLFNQIILYIHQRQEKSSKYTRQTGVSLEPLLDLTLSKS